MREREKECKREKESKREREKEKERGTAEEAVNERISFQSLNVAVLGHHIKGDREREELHIFFYYYYLVFAVSLFALFCCCCCRFCFG